MRFSERMGLVPPKMLQVDSMDDDLRNGLWNVCLIPLWSSENNNNPYLPIIWTRFLKETIDTIDHLDFFIKKSIKNKIFSSKYYVLYDFIQYIVDYIDPDLVSMFNEILETERSAFRFIDRQLTRITDQNESEAVASAMKISDQFSGARSHIRSAVAMFGQRGSPDYRNVIREAISAVESASKIVSQNEKADLSAAIKAIEKAHGMHSAFKDAITKLYGWTSDESGIRHGLLQESAVVDEADAHFMLVTCAAFVNYLVSKYGVVKNNTN